MELPIEDLKPVYSKLVTKSAWSALDSYTFLIEAILPEKEITAETRNRLMRVSMTHLSEAFSLVSQFQMLYSLDSDDRDVIEDYINQFYSYNKEFLDCEETNHSHSHTMEYFRNFSKTFKPIASLLDIDLDYLVERANSHF
uniref:hypothetical protein n=1 Tax=Enterococcus gallinarum TaxID=1353 RepID=UPI0011CA3FF8|nr:hypothetical protein [Enterococcus gallinarum]MEB5857699.1 hypothetical protein [Enterococcus gallinarum]MEB6041179.1 hypothetical protein [Enterococcus gallinarum]DAM97814.1 MAG TPA: hypothetical protein [Caudoviricetes sp.]